MTNSDEPKSFIARLYEAKKAMKPLVKDAKNPFFKNNYATLGAVLDVVEAPLEANGIFLLQSCSMTKVGLLTVTNTLQDSCSDASVVDVSDMPVKEHMNPQEFGSASTYARRYSLVALFALSAEDDDGNVGSGTPAKPQTPAAAPGVKPQPWKKS